MNEPQRPETADLTMDPTATATGKPVAQPSEQPPAPIPGEGADGRPRPGNPNDGHQLERDIAGEPSSEVASDAWNPDPRTGHLPRTDAARAERAQDSANADKKPAGPPVHIGPGEEREAPSGRRLIQLVGGPRNGCQSWIPAESTSVTTDVDGQRHEYRAGANLPHDFVDRVPAQNAPIVYFGYYGPDPEHVKSLHRQYREDPNILPGGATLPAKGSAPAVSVDF